MDTGSCEPYEGSIHMMSDEIFKAMYYLKPEPLSLTFGKGESSQA